MTNKLMSVLLLASLLVCATSCGSDYTIDPDGVTVKMSQDSPSDVQLVKIQVVDKNIIHISATPADELAAISAPLASDKPATTPEFTVAQTDDTVTVTTSALKTSIVLTTGEVRFADTNGNILLQEQHGGGKQFTPTEINGTSGYSVKQVFESPADEAFYGLGLQPSGTMNYKSKSEELFQKGDNASIPFIVSNKKYGLLMDCNTRCSFGSNDAALQEKQSWWNEMCQQLDYYFIASNSIDGVISSYRRLTGKAPIVPKRALGNWLDCSRARSQEALLSTLRELRNRQIPIDNIIIADSNKLDRDSFPNLAALADSIRAMNMHIAPQPTDSLQPNGGSDGSSRAFTLTHAGRTGQQRLSAATLNCQAPLSWNEMKSQIAAGLNFSICGTPYWGTAIGDTCIDSQPAPASIDEWRELNVRWAQFSTFCPIALSHLAPWEIAPEDSAAYQSVTHHARLRYRLMPYLYTLAAMTWFNDYTIMRPLIMDFTADEAVNDIGDQYMFGTAIMVAPVCEYGARSRTVYLPQCAGWYDFYTGNFIAAGQAITAEAPYGQIPLFVRAGSIIPAGQTVQHTSDNAEGNNTIRLYVYEGADAQFNLYEDDGTSLGYQQGHFSTIPITYSESSKTLTIGNRKGQYDGMPNDRNFIVIPVGKNHPRPFDPDMDGAVIKYSGREVTVKAM